MAALSTSERGTDATATVRFNVELFDALCSARGAETGEARAALVGVNRSTLYRYRHGRTIPSLAEANRFAGVFGLTAADLWPGVAG